MKKWALFLGFVMVSAFAPHGEGAEIPPDFPTIEVPGLEQEMIALRDLFYLHYVPAQPLATLWDEWISGSSLWPAVETNGRMDLLRGKWAGALAHRDIDPEGYVATHQHASIAHQQGWPFPFWKQGGEGTWGHHFSLQSVPSGWHGTEAKDQTGWVLTGGEDRGVDEVAWRLRLILPSASVEAPPLRILPEQAPFLQLRWMADPLASAQPYVEWKTEADPRYSSDRRFYFAPPQNADRMDYTMIPVYLSPAWKGVITGLRIQFNNPQPGSEVSIQALFTQYDTRHTINNQNFIRGCCQYVAWSRDLNFLRSQISRMRLALAYMRTTLGGDEHKCIMAPFVGHDGRSGLEWKDGKKIIHSGRGIGNNYWDLLPMGHQDAYATMHYYDTLRYMAELEEQIAAHPEWNIPGGVLQANADELRAHAAEVKAVAGKLFWNADTGRFVCGIDVDGTAYDYGFTFLNLEAIYYGFATEEQAHTILDWMNGKRLVAGDTSQGEDIYHWRFAPRATTKRNIEYYGWFWNSPESIPWGGQVQDGGAVLGFSYHDLMARLRHLSPANSWTRLQAILDWYREVQAAGGYRAYYKEGKEGTLQGGGTAGGLGLDQEFFESLLVPQVMLNGFLGFTPRLDGFALKPALPAEWPLLRISRIHFHHTILDITATPDRLRITVQGRTDGPIRIQLPSGVWKAGINGGEEQTIPIDSENPAWMIQLEDQMELHLIRA